LSGNFAGFLTTVNAAEIFKLFLPDIKGTEDDYDGEEKLAYRFYTCRNDGKYVVDRLREF